jgi:hypothetical protein
MSYEPYEPHDAEESVETAGHAGFLDWLAAHIHKTVSERDHGYISPGELKPYPYELAACATHIRELEQTLLKTLREFEKQGLVPPELHAEIICLLRTPAEWQEHEKKMDAKHKIQERAKERGLLKTLSPEDKKRYRAQQEFRRRLFSGKA